MKHLFDGMIVVLYVLLNNVVNEDVNTVARHYKKV
jgi:hypothetical protein